jgi:hypothetical protein
LVEIEYRAKSAEGKVRHPFFKGPAGGSVMDRRKFFTSASMVALAFVLPGMPAGATQTKDALDLWWEWAVRTSWTAGLPARLGACINFLV